jgi:hypothetical protein
MLAFLLLPFLAAPPAQDPFDPARFEATVARIQKAALADATTWQRMEQLCDDIGHRISGSPALAQAITWARDTLKSDGHPTRLMPVAVPYWRRGDESLRMVEPNDAPLPMLGLGWSIGTPPEGVKAEVLVVQNEAEFEALGDRVKGRIVLFNNRMPDYHPEKGTGYGTAVRFRVGGAKLVAAKGGVAALVRSVTAHSLRTPHTGTQSYKDGTSPVPAAAITTEDADRIARLAARGKRVVVELKMQAKLVGDRPSHNVIAEIRGREKPDEVVLMGGHIDSWDVGQGAHDDGGGIVTAMQALRTLRRLKLTPRRTLRVVLFTNEEAGKRGALAYAKAVEGETHVAAIEADKGAFEPTGYDVEHAEPQRAAMALMRLHQLKPLFRPLGATHMVPGFSGADVRPLKPTGTALFGHRTNMHHYFDVHHTEADTLDKVDPLQMRQNVAAMATLAWILAEAPGRIDLP